MYRRFVLPVGAALVAACLVLASTSAVKAESDKATAEFMKKYHKAPKGTDPICKKAGGGTASAEELAGLLAGYQAMCGSKPAKGEVGPWQEKCKALIAAVKGLQAKDATAGEAYKKAVACKDCHSAHKPD